MAADTSACPLAPVAAEMAALVAACRRLDERCLGLAGPAYIRAQARMEAAASRMDVLETLAGQHRASSAEGALLQLAVAHGLVDEMDCRGFDPDAARGAQAIRTLKGCLHSLAALVEAQSGVTREAMGGDYYMRRELDPHAALAEALAEGGA